jgi:hypothetical protein
MGLGEMSCLSLPCRGVTEAGASKKPTRARKRRLENSIHLLLVVLLLFSPAAMPAKDKTPTTRTVSGMVMDEAENPIKGATVELKDLQTQKVLDIYSQEDGQYQYSELRFDHDYTVQAAHNGLSSEVRQVSSIDTRWHMVLNLTLLKSSK